MSDSGAASDDNLTNLNNGSSDATLQFEVMGVAAGAEVRIYSDGVQIGQGTASGETATIVTDGMADLADGVRNITATQAMGGLEGPMSPVLSVSIDTMPPATIENTAPNTAEVDVQYTFDPSSPDEGQTGVEYSLVGGPSGMTIDTQSGAISWTPTEDQVEPQSFQIGISDEAGNSALQTINVTVLGALPAVPDDYEVNEDSPLIVDVARGVLANDGDADSGQLSAEIVESPENGSLSLNSDGSFTYTPDNNFFGIDSFTYRAADATRESNVARVSVDVLPVNDPVVADDDSYTAERGTPVNIAAGVGLLANDSDIDGDTLTTTIATQATNGVVVLNADGSFRYTPDAGFSGTDSFTYTVQDGNGQEDTATVSITVTDSGGASLSGFVYIDANGDGERGVDEVGVPGVLITLSGTSDAGESVNRTAITLNNGSYLFDGLPPGTYELTETQPQALMDGSESTDVPAAVVEDDRFTELTVSGVQSFTANNFAEMNLRPEYVSIAWFFASSSSQSDVFREMVAIGEGRAGNTDLAKAIREGDPGLPDDANSPPLAVADFYSVDQDMVLNVDAARGVLANDRDVDGDELTATMVGPADNGSVTFNADGSFTYTPNSGFVGTDAFTYTARDGLSASNEATVRITVSGTTNAFRINENSPADTFVGTVTASTDLGDPRIYQIADSSLSQDLKLVADDHLSGDPAASVVLIEYLDFQCPICRQFHPFVEQLKDDFGGELLVVQRHLPLTEIHFNAFAGARAAEAAGRQGMFDEMGDLLFENQEDWEFEDDPLPFFDQYADQLGLDLDQFAADMADPAIDARITRDSDAAARLGASGTPTFFLNGQLLVEPQSGDLDGLVQAEVDRADDPFLLDRTTGDLLVSGLRDLDFETDSSFSLSIEITDVAGRFELATATIDLLDVNELPLALSDSYSVDQDGTLEVDAARGLFRNDTDEDGDALTAILVTGTRNGQLTLNDDGSFTYTPSTGFAGVDTFTYRVSDGLLTSDTATVVLTVNEVNVAPVAVPDAFDVEQDQVLEVDAGSGVLRNDTDADGDSITAALVSPPANGVLTLMEDGSFIYTPDAGFTGTDSFTYQASDRSQSSEIATVTLTVNQVNTAPVAASDTYVVVEDNVLEVNEDDGVLDNDTDADGDSITATVVDQPIHGVLEFNADGSFVYTPEANFSGTDGFTYLANDGQASSGLVTVEINVDPVNDPPFASADRYSVDEDGVLEISAAAGPLANDTDPDEGDVLTAALIGPPDHGDVTFNSDGSFVYSPDAGFSGTDTLIYEVSDGELVAQGSVTITINPKNDVAPVAEDDSYNVSIGEELIVGLDEGILSNDSDGDGDQLSATVVSDPASGTLTLAPDGSFSYIPDSGFRGIDQFDYTASDGVNVSGEATVTITVNGVPLAADDAYDVDVDGRLEIEAPGVLGNDSDADGNTLNAILATDVTNGTLTLNINGAFVYTPAAGFEGIDSFTYTAIDGLSDSIPATVTITVGSANNAPVAVDDAFEVTAGETLEIDLARSVLANDTDADGDMLTAAVATDVANGTLTFNDDGSFTYSPASGFEGTDSFTYTANDGLADSAPAVVTIAVRPANRAPVAGNDAFNVAVDGSLEIDEANGVLANDSDADGDMLTVSLTTDVASGTLTLSDDGSFQYAPNAGFHGVDSFAYTVTDGILAEQAIATIFVNSRPTATNDQYEVGEDATLQIDAATGILANDADADDDPLTITIKQSPFNGTLDLNPDGSFTYTPDADFDGTDAFTYSINDGFQDSEPAAALLILLPANDLPLAVEDSYAVDQGEVLEIVVAAGVLANDRDVDGDTLSARLVQNPTAGNIKFNPDGSFDFGAAADFTGVVTFTYIANDGTGDSAETTVTVTVNPADQGEGEADALSMIAVTDQALADEDDWLSA